MTKPACFLTVFFVMFATVKGAEFVLVDDGGRPVPVIVSKAAPPSARRAAVTLVDYIEKISGARPELIEAMPAPVPARALWVGLQPALKTLFPSTSFEFQHAEETLIA